VQQKTHRAQSRVNCK